MTDVLTRLYLQGLQSFKEDDFTRKIIQPLFEAMGYQRVEFHGGPFERGRDLIATIKVPPSRTPKVVYVQSKKIPNQKRKGAGVISTLGHQIRQACCEEFKSLDGSDLHPSVVYIACPEALTQRFLEELRNQFKYDKLSNVEILFFDGIEIIEAIKEYKPDLFDILTDFEDKFSPTFHDYSGNCDLLNALNAVRKEIDIKHFYSDLSFFVGSLDSNLLMHLDLEFKNSTLCVDEEEWSLIKRLIYKLDNEFNLFVLFNSIEFIENDYECKYEAYTSDENKNNINQRKLNIDANIDSEERIKGYLESLDSSVSMFYMHNKDDHEAKNQVKNIQSLLKNFVYDMFKGKNSLEQLSKMTVFSGSDRDSFVKVQDNINKSIENIKDETIKYIESKNTIYELDSLISTYPKYTISVKIEELKSLFESKRYSYIKSVGLINNKNIAFAEVKKFLRETERTLYFLSLFVSDSSPFSGLINLSKSKSYSDRVEISPLDVFSTGYDVAVYGGAGVGKTTTLEMYHNTIADDESIQSIYIPLNKLANKVLSNPKITHVYNKKGDLVKNDELLYRLILTYKDFEVNSENISKIKSMLMKSSSLILDGIDEVYNIIPNLFDGINLFKETHANTQIIVSSRDCVSYLDKINFLGISLLPFTKEQVENFIKGWFANDHDVAEKLIRNIDKRNLYDCVKTPLILTITCNLVEKGIDAPSTESEIYTARLNLLTGEYDQHKKVSRQTHSGDTLRKVARKLAYIMHLKRVRSIDRDVALKSLYTNFGSHYNKGLIESCVDELIKVCNVLVVDSYSQDISFGHFRFQEHLVSVELSQNRSLEMADFAKVDWWRGALSIFAQTHDIEFLIVEIYSKNQSIYSASRTLKAMMEQTPIHLKNKTKELIERYLSMDAMDDMVWNDEDYSY